MQKLTSEQKRFIRIFLCHFPHTFIDSYPSDNFTSLISFLLNYSVELTETDVFNLIEFSEANPIIAGGFFTNIPKRHARDFKLGKWIKEYLSSEKNRTQLPLILACVLNEYPAKEIPLIFNLAVNAKSASVLITLLSHDNFHPSILTNNDLPRFVNLVLALGNPKLIQACLAEKYSNVMSDYLSDLSQWQSDFLAPAPPSPNSMQESRGGS